MSKDQISKMKKIFALATLLMASALVAGLSLVLSYNFTMANRLPGYVGPRHTSSAGGGSGDDQRQSLPSINILILGIDDEANLPDIILVGHLNGETHKIDIISIPRDTRVVIDQQIRDSFARVNRNAPPIGREMILNNLFTWAGAQRGGGTQVMQDYIENLLDIEFDYHIVLDLVAFRHIVDAVGGIYVDVPFRLFYVQGGDIDIDLQAGFQRLDGRQAEQFVRFRNHPLGDLTRIQLQQTFMQAFFEQALTLDAILSNPIGFLVPILEQTITNMGIASLIRYDNMNILDAINAENIRFHMAEGGLGSGVFFHMDKPATRQLMQDIISGNIHQQEAEEHEEALDEED